MIYDYCVCRSVTVYITHSTGHAVRFLACQQSKWRSLCSAIFSVVSRHYNWSAVWVRIYLFCVSTVFTGFKITDTDRIVCDGSMQRYGVRQSVRLSVPSIDRCSSARRVAAVGQVGRKYRSTTAPPQQRPSATNASSVISSADWGRWTQICIWERT